MKNIKLKLGDVIHSYNGEHDDHVVQLCNLLLINKRGSYSQIEGFYCDVCKKAYAKNLQYLKENSRTISMIVPLNIWSLMRKSIV